MRSINFPESNVNFGLPLELDASQCRPVRAYAAQISSGSLDGAIVVVTAWQPDPIDIARIAAGEPVYLSVIGGLPPHFLSTNFMVIIP